MTATPTLHVWCPTCEQQAVPDARGRCMWCDTTIGQVAPPPGRVIFPPRGCAPMLTDTLLEHARQAYYLADPPSSLSRIARDHVAGSGYASWRTLAAALRDQFIAHGWPIRGRIDEAVRVITIHGRARRGHKDRAYERERRRACGTVRGVMCAGVRANPPHRGAPCKLYARAGSLWCRHHDPALATQRADELAAVRARRQETTT